MVGNNHIDKNAPIHPKVMYIVMDNHFGMRSGPNMAVSIIPKMARLHATPRNDQPMTEV
jgi:hypothetical protein